MLKPKTKMPLSTPLTLIVATTPIPHHLPTNARPKLGIGQNGTLPWPRIKADMSFFARVTSRPPATRPGSTNAVIMGRKTYESIPEKLRPLGKRINVVVTRDVEGNAGRVQKELEGKRERDANRAAEAKAQGKAGGAGTGTEGTTDAIVSESLEGAMGDLEGVYGTGEESRLGNIYIIGGGEIYASALRSSARLNRKIRIVMTNVKRKGDKGYDCDTFFPVDDFSAENGWRTASPGEVSEWVGKGVDGEWRDEGEVVIQMVGYERVD